MTYIALLRAINVGGRSLISMPDLRTLFGSLGFSEVKTYIQTGNVIFNADKKPPTNLAEQIEKALKKKFKFGTTVFVLTVAELKKAAENNPLEPEKLDKQQHCHLVFLSSSPKADKQKSLMEMAGREYRFRINGKVFYYAYDRKDAGSRRRNIPFEKTLGVTATARTWKVVEKLIQMAEK
jgi:uncharacterized protein (DUF1697 family)